MPLPKRYRSRNQVGAAFWGSTGSTPTKDMRVPVAGGVTFQGYSFPASNTYVWADLGGDVFDDWGYFTLQRESDGAKVGIPFTNLNGPDDTVYTETFSAFGETWELKHGWVAAGVFKIDIRQATQASGYIPVSFHMGGEWGADGDDIYNKNYWYATTYDGKDLGVASMQHYGGGDPEFWIYWVPYNPALTTNALAGNYPQYSYSTEFCHFWFPNFTEGLTVYFSKGATNISAKVALDTYEESSVSNKINVSGAWKTPVAQFVNISGTWKNVVAQFINVNGTWKSVYNNNTATLTISEAWYKNDIPYAEDVGVDGFSNVYIGYSYQSVNVRKLNPSGTEVWNKTDISDVWGICADNVGNSYCAYSNGNIRKLDSTGSQQWNNADLTSGQGIAVDSNENVYVAYDNGTKAVRKLNDSGVEVWYNNGTSGAEDIAVDNNSNVYVAHSSNASKAIRKLNSSGGEVWYKSCTSIAWGVAVDNLGNVYGALPDTSPYLVKWDSNGNVVWSKTDFGGTKNVAVDSGYNVYSISASNAKAVRKLDSAGNEIWYSNIGASTSAEACTVDASNNFYVAYWNSSGRSTSKFTQTYS